MGFRRKPGPLLIGLPLGLQLLFGLVALAQQISLSALAHHPHLCQTTRDADGRHYPGFFCPRLSDTPEEAYCCHLQAAGASCCTQAEFEALYQVNVSTLPPQPILRGTGPLIALGLYSLILVTLMTVDLLHFCRGRNSGHYEPRAPSSTARPLQVPAGTY